MAKRLKWRLTAIAALALALGASAQSTDDPVDEDLAAAHSEYLANDALQLERPEPEAPEPIELDTRETPGWLRAIQNFFGAVIRVLSPLLQVLFWGGLAAAACAIAFFIFREALGRRRHGASGRGGEPVIIDRIAPSARPDAAAARSLLEQADALASAGRFAEAVHLLLFRSIEDIQARNADGVPKSLTAREIGRLDGLPAEPRKALAPIISLVERSFFGGRSVDADGWRQARESYTSFAFGEAWT